MNGSPQPNAGGTERSEPVAELARPLPRASARLAAAETGLIFLLFFLYAGWLVPDVNEAHYLAKARHFWDPQWCGHDFFLQTGDAHQVFYWTLGLLTRFCSLTAAAWIGRVITWLALAAAWRSLSWTLIPQRGVSLLSAGLFVALLHWTHLAGEWVVGGVEAKGFAYALLLVAVERLARQRWRTAWWLLGAATSFHVLVGGWGLVAMSVAWLLSRSSRPGIAATLTSIALAVLLALPGLIPALRLQAGVDPEVVRQAARIYVFERLPHHLLFYRFDWLNVLRHAALLCGWIGLLLVWRRSAAARSSEAAGILAVQRFVAGAVAIGLIGVLLSLLLGQQPDWTAALLRYYWFRLSDVALPIGVTFLVLAGLVSLYRSRPRQATLGLAVALLLVAVHFGTVIVQRRSDFRPLAVAQTRPLGKRSVRWARYEYEEWVRVCRWVQQNTPADTVFITPRKQQTFLWYAHRAEVASWKNVPQDAAGLVAWWKRIEDLRVAQRIRPGQAKMNEHLLLQCAHRYGASMIVVDRGRSSHRLSFRRIYPQGAEAGLFEVYRLPAPESDSEANDRPLPPSGGEAPQTPEGGRDE